MKVREIPLSALQPKDFIKKKMADIAADVKNGIAINALSGGVDSSVVTLLGFKTLGKQLKTYISLLLECNPSLPIPCKQSFLMEGRGFDNSLLISLFRCVTSIRSRSLPGILRTALTPYKPV